MRDLFMRVPTKFDTIKSEIIGYVKNVRSECRVSRRAARVERAHIWDIEARGAGNLFTLFGILKSSFGRCPNAPLIAAYYCSLSLYKRHLNFHVIFSLCIYRRIIYTSIQKEKNKKINMYLHYVK